MFNVALNMQLNHSIEQESETTPSHEDRNTQPAVNCASHQCEPYSPRQLFLSVPTQHKAEGVRLPKTREAPWTAQDCSVTSTSGRRGLSRTMVSTGLAGFVVTVV